MNTTNEFGYSSRLAAETWQQRLERIHAMQRANGLRPSNTVILPKPCGRCGDTDRFDDQGDSVCSTCGLTRRASK